MPKGGDRFDPDGRYRLSDHLDQNLLPEKLEGSRRAQQLRLRFTSCGRRAGLKRVLQVQYSVSARLHGDAVEILKTWLYRNPGKAQHIRHPHGPTTIRTGDAYLANAAAPGKTFLPGPSVRTAARHEPRHRTSDRPTRLDMIIASRGARTLPREPLSWAALNVQATSMQHML